MREQSTDTVLMILPKSFGFNSETAASNTFQNKENKSDLNELARSEVLQMANQLRDEGVQVWLEEDETDPACPDAVFPNNWLGVHPSGEMVLYPMLATNRRLERRSKLIASIQKRLPAHRIVDMSHHERSNDFLEGTGSLVFDHIEHVVYASKSPRTSESLARMVAQRMNYQLTLLEAKDTSGKEIYHTNVVLSIGTYFAIAASSCLSRDSMEEIRSRMKSSGRMLVEITNSQMNSFAGNVLELKNDVGEKLIVLSETAFDSLSAEQIAGLQQCGLLVPISVKNIEHVGGGSVRCMLAEIYAID